MAQLQLIIGDKNLSSWSMRAWLAAKASELNFEEVMVPLDQPETKTALSRLSPSQLIPCLIDGDLKIWDSLAICEYLAELSPSTHLWPTDKASRALARSYVAEMHSGFTNLRSQLSMDIRLKIEIRHLTPQTIREIDRILFLWTNALAKSNGPYLFGSFGIVDAFYAPVVFRFLSYGIQIENSIVTEYMSAIQNNRYVREWVSAGLDEKPKPVIFGELKSLDQ